MSNEKPFDPTKPVQTRDGRLARIICTDRKTRDLPYHSIVALIYYNGGESAMFFRPDGRDSTSIEQGHDLVNVPERKVETRKIIPNKFRPQELGHFATTSSNIYHAARVFGYLDFITEDGELVDVVFRPKENKL